LSGLGNLSTALVRLLDTLDDTNSNRLSHITDGKPSKRGIIGESLDTHGLGGNHLDDGSVTRLDKLGGIFNLLAGSSIDLLEEFGEFAGNVGSVTVEDGGVSSTDLTGVIQDDDLSVEGITALGGVVLGVTANVASADFLDRDVLNVESDIVTGETFDEGFVVHFHRLDFGGDVGGSKGDDHAGFDDTGFNTADGYCADTADFVDVLEGQAEGLVGRSYGGFDRVDGLEEGKALGGSSLGLLGPALEPRHVGGFLNHVLKILACCKNGGTYIAVPTRDGDEGNSLGVVSNLLDEVGSFLDNFVESGFRPLGGIHLVNGDNELLDTQGVGQQGVFTGLTVLGDTSFEFTDTSSNDH
jgi:hypothetical protein